MLFLILKSLKRKFQTWIMKCKHFELHVDSVLSFLSSTQRCAHCFSQIKEQKKPQSAYVLIWRPYNGFVIKNKRLRSKPTYTFILPIIVLLFGVYSPTELELKILLLGASAEETSSL